MPVLTSPIEAAAIRYVAAASRPTKSEQQPKQGLGPPVVLLDRLVRCRGSSSTGSRAPHGPLAMEYRRVKSESTAALGPRMEACFLSFILHPLFIAPVVLSSPSWLICRQGSGNSTGGPRRCSSVALTLASASRYFLGRCESKDCWRCLCMHAGHPNGGSHAVLLTFYEYG
jgi:hypothetical protein